MKRWQEILGITLCWLIQAGLVVRFWGRVPLWVMLPLVLLAFVLADLISALFHWFFDTWFEVDTPVLGPIIRPFREHHTDPLSILQHDLIGTAGPACWLGVFALVPAFWAAPWLAFLLSWVATFATQADTVHQWSHARGAPFGWARWLQRHGVLQSPEDHDRHHVPPHKQGWATLAGWWNPVLDRALPYLERVIRAF